MPATIVKRLNCSSTSKPDQRLQHQEHRRPPDAHLSGRNRPRARALDPGVDVAIDEVVPGAAGAAHHDGADQEQHDVPGIGPPCAGRDRGERRRPPARQQQQPPADRPVEPRQPQIGPHPGRRDGIDPVSGRIGDASGGCRLMRLTAERTAGQRVEGAAARLRRCRPAGSGRRARRSGVGAARPGGPALHTCLRICCVRAWLASTCLMASGGTPQAFWLVSRNFTILPSDATNLLNSGQTSSRVALRSLAALMRAGVLFRLRRGSAGNSSQTAALLAWRRPTATGSAKRRLRRRRRAGRLRRTGLAGGRERLGLALRAAWPGGGGNGLDCCCCRLTGRRRKRVRLLALRRRPGGGGNGLDCAAGAIWPGGGGNCAAASASAEQG